MCATEAFLMMIPRAWLLGEQVTGICLFVVMISLIVIIINDNNSELTMNMIFIS